MNILTNHRSLNFNNRKQAIKYIILHYTEFKTDEEAIDILCSKKSNVSAHYLVSQSGKEIFSLVDNSKRAWHAGASFWRGESDLNSLSIGIEISYYANVKKNIFPPFNPAQIKSLIKLCKFLKLEYNIKDINILAHSDIAPLRKIDPGESFPWQKLAQEGLGIFPNEFNTSQKIDRNDCLEHYLGTIGYSCENMQKSVQAFQRRYFVKDLKENKISSQSISFAKYLAKLTLESNE